MFLGITFKELLGAYTSNKLIAGRAAVFVIAILVSVGISLVRIFRSIQSTSEGDGSREWWVKRTVTLLKPLIPYYIVIGTLPFVMTTIEFGLDKVFDKMGVSKLEDVTDYDKSTKRYLLELNEKYEILSEREAKAYLFEGLNYSMQKMEVNTTIFFLKLIKRISTYLFGFAAGAYFLWLIGIEVFTPIAVLGFFYKDLSNIRDRWLQNYVSCKMFLILIYVSNGLSVFFYKIFLFDDYNIIVTGIIFILFRVYLYRQALSLASKVF